MPLPALLSIATEIIGGGLSLIQGNEQERESKRLELEAQKVKPLAEDPEERSFLNDLQRKRRQIATGTTYQQQFSDIGSINRSTQQGVIRASGGAGGAAIAGITRGQQNANSAMQGVIQQGQQQEFAYTGMANMLNSRLASRRFELENQRYNTLLGQSADAKLAGRYNKNAGISSIIGGVLSGVGQIAGNANKAPVTGSPAANVPPYQGALKMPNEEVPRFDKYGRKRYSFGGMDDLGGESMIPFNQNFGTTIPYEEYTG